MILQIDGGMQRQQVFHERDMIVMSGNHECTGSTLILIIDFDKWFNLAHSINGASMSTIEEAQMEIDIQFQFLQILHRSLSDTLSHRCGVETA